MPYPTQWAGYDPQKFMCCDCGAILDTSECAIDTDGEKIDVCVPCIDHENEMIERKKKDGTLARNRRGPKISDQ